MVNTPFGYLKSVLPPHSRLLLTMTGQGQGRHEHQRVWDAVGGQQQRQLIQNVSAQISVFATCLLLLDESNKRGKVLKTCLFHMLLCGRDRYFPTSRRGRHNKSEKSQAFIQTHGAGLHLRQTQYELESNRKISIMPANTPNIPAYGLWQKKD